MFFYNDLVNVCLMNINSGLVRVVKIINLLLFFENILFVKVFKRYLGEEVLLELFFDM